MSMKLTTTSKTILLGIAFQLVWLSLVATANSSYYWFGPLVGIATYGFILFQLRSTEISIPLMSASFVGFSFDLMMDQMGIINLHSNQLTYSWLLILWLVFVGCFHQLFSWLSNFNSYTSFLFGSLGGVLSYYAASILGAVEIIRPNHFVLVYSFFWGISFLIASKVIIARSLTANRRQTSENY